MSISRADISRILQLTLVLLLYITNWTANNSFRATLPSTAVFSSQFSSPIVADINGNGIKEVATAWKIDPDSTSGNQDYNPFINDIFGFGEWGTVGESWSGAAIFFNAVTGKRTLTYHIHQLVEAGLGIRIAPFPPDRTGIPRVASCASAVRLLRCEIAGAGRDVISRAAERIDRAGRETRLRLARLARARPVGSLR